MKKSGPIFVSDLKNKKTISRKKRTVDAKTAYAFVNKLEKSRSVRALGAISRRAAQVATSLENRIVESIPFRIGAGLLKHPLVGKASRRLGKSLRITKLK